MYGDPNGEGGVGASYRSNPATWAHVRDLQMGVYTNEDQTVINGGSTLEFYVDDNFGLGGRVLIGAANNDTFTDEYHFTGDLYAGTTRVGEHWFKGGVLYDIQDNFHKLGPEIGMLLFADRRHPINLDFAYGLGYGDPIINRVNSTITTVAEDDAQLRVGTYLTPNLQAGFSGNWVNFSGSEFQDYNGYGGYINLNLGTLNINVDYTTGDHRDRGFVNVAYTFGGRRSRAADGCDLAFVEHPRDWMGKPVMRDVSLQTQRAFVANLPPLPPGSPGTPGAPGTPGGPPLINTGVGNLTQVNVGISNISGPNQIVLPGTNFNLTVQLVNGSTANATLISAGGVTTTTNQTTVLQGPPFNVGTLLPGQSTTFQLPSAGGLFGGIINVSNTAQFGDTFFVDFDVSANGQTRRYRTGPIVVGTTGVTALAPATPLN
jgi:hypothetical protein